MVYPRHRAKILIASSPPVGIVAPDRNTSASKSFETRNPKGWKSIVPSALGKETETLVKFRFFFGLMSRHTHKEPASELVGGCVIPPDSPASLAAEKVREAVKPACETGSEKNT